MTGTRTSKGNAPGGVACVNESNRSVAEARFSSLTASRNQRETSPWCIWYCQVSHRPLRRFTASTSSSGHRG